jgi:hypothetical protein
MKVRAVVNVLDGSWAIRRRRRVHTYVQSNGGKSEITARYDGTGQKESVKGEITMMKHESLPTLKPILHVTPDKLTPVAPVVDILTTNPRLP